MCMQAWKIKVNAMFERADQRYTSPVSRPLAVTPQFSTDLHCYKAMEEP